MILPLYNEVPPSIYTFKKQYRLYSYCQRIVKEIYNNMAFLSKFEKELGKWWGVTDSDLKRDSELSDDLSSALSILYDRLKEQNSKDWKRLGAGYNGFVYWLSDRSKILKVSKDYRDLQASEKIRKKPDKNLIKVYDVFEMGLPYFQEKGFIVSEKLTPLSSSDKKKWQNVIDSTRGKVPWVNIPTLRTLTVNWCVETQQWLESDEAYDAPDVVIEDLQECLPILKKWAILLDDERGIEWGDLALDNLMKRGNTTLISDVGFGSVRGAPSIPNVEID